MIEAMPCTVCRARRPVPLWEVNGFVVSRCWRCGHRFVASPPSADELLDLYDDGYFQNPSFEKGDGGYFGYGDHFAERANMDRLRHRVLARAERYAGVGKLLDIGCGPGFLVDVAQRRGWDAWGVDVNASAVAWAGEHGIANVRAGGPESLADEGPFDCVVLFDVIEHLHDPRASVTALWEQVAPGGALVVVTPDMGSAVGRAMGKHWMEVRRIPEHLHFFDGPGLAQLLHHSGFTVRERHSIGAIASVHTLLGHLRFYAPRAVGAVDRVVAELGHGDASFEVDPGSKLCMYAVRDREPQPLDEFDGRRPPSPARVSRRRFRLDEPRDAAPPVVEVDADAGFDERQRRYWEARERFLDPRDAAPTAFAEPKLDWVERHVELGPDTTVLDVGAGNGTLTWPLSRRSKRVVGLDRSENLLRRSPCTGRMVQGDATVLPFADRTFDVVVESNFLHHAADPVAVLREMARVSRRHVLLIEPNRFHPPMAVFMALSRPDWRGLRFDREHLAQLVDAAGLRLVAASAQGAIYPNATPARVLGRLARFDAPTPLGAFVVAVAEIA